MPPRRVLSSDEDSDDEPLAQQVVRSLVLLPTDRTNPVVFRFPRNPMQPLPGPGTTTLKPAK
jgi:hypothetical protein